MGTVEFLISPVLEVGQGIDAIDGTDETVLVLSSRAGCCVGEDANGLRMKTGCKKSYVNKLCVMFVRARLTRNEVGVLALPGHYQ